MNEKHFNAFYLMKLFEGLDYIEQCELIGQLEKSREQRFKRKCLEEYNMHLVHYPSRNDDKNALEGSPNVPGKGGK